MGIDGDCFIEGLRQVCRPAGDCAYEAATKTTQKCESFAADATCARFGEPCLE